MGFILGTARYVARRALYSAVAETIRGRNTKAARQRRHVREILQEQRRQDLITWEMQDRAGQLSEANRIQLYAHLLGKQVRMGPVESRRDWVNERGQKMTTYTHN